MFKIFKSKKTNFKGGYLHLDKPLSSSSVHVTHDKFIAPRKIDNRDMCIATSNQYHTPHCAGYATAGFIEFVNWKKYHFPKQVDGDAIYKEAKKTDPNKNEGTSLFHAAKAASRLGFISGSNKYINGSMNDVKFALHEFGMCIGGFAITDEWNSVDKKTGIIDEFGVKAKSLGGHAVLITGYDGVGVYIQNSWGSNWGIHGFAILRWRSFHKQFFNGMVFEHG